MNVIFFGTPSFVVPILKVLNQKYDVVAVVTAPDKPVGRKQLLTPSPVKEFGVKHNIEVLTPEKFQISNFKFQIPNPDLFVVAAYGKIIPKEILHLPRYGAINIHPSELPKYRGPSPITQTILNGDTTSAISFMQMDEKMDHGPIIKSIPYDIPEDATTESLTPQMFQKSAELLPEIIDYYVAGNIKPIPQDHDKATYTKIITKQDGYIDFSSLEKLNELEIRNLKLEIARKIRAYYPWPGVWSNIRIRNQESRIRLLPAFICNPEHDKRHPELVSGSHEIPDQVRNDNDFCIQMEGKNPVSLKDFLNGYPELKSELEKIVS